MLEIDLTNLNESAEALLIAQSIEHPQPTMQVATQGAPLYHDSPVYRVRDLPWDHISTDVRGITHVESALTAAKLNWKVAQYPIQVNGVTIPKRVANVREDSQEFIEVVSNRYVPVQNSEAFAFMEGVLGSGAMQLENAGSFGYDSIFLLAKADGINVLGDKVVPYALIKNSHDGSSGVKVCLTPIRVICKNTLAMALRTAPRVWQAKHLGSIAGRMQEARDMLKIVMAYTEEYPVVAERMNSINIGEDEIVSVLQKMFPIKADGGVRAVENAALQAKEILTIYNGTPDLKKFHGTAWGFFNAVGDYTTHHAPKETQSWRENRLNVIANGHPLMAVAQAQLMAIPA